MVEQRIVYVDIVHSINTTALWVSNVWVFSSYEKDFAWTRSARMSVCITANNAAKVDVFIRYYNINVNKEWPTEFQETSNSA